MTEEAEPNSKQGTEGALVIPAPVSIPLNSSLDLRSYTEGHLLSG